MIYITRTETFSAAHKLAKPDWPDEKNRQVFGKCSNANWHGHNYELVVTVKGEVNPETGFLANLTDLSAVIRSRVLDKVDHRNLNLDVDFMQGKLASTEVLAIEFWKQLEQPISVLGCSLHCIKIRETAKNFVEYYGT